MPGNWILFQIQEGGLWAFGLNTLEFHSPLFNLHRNENGINLSATIEAPFTFCKDGKHWLKVVPQVWINPPDENQVQAQRKDS